MAMTCRTRLICRFPPGQAMALLVAGGDVQRGGAVPGREAGRGGEAGDVSDVADESGRTTGSDAVQLLQTATGLGEQLDQLHVGRFDLLVDAGHLGNEFRGESTLGAPHEVARTHGVEQGAGLGGGQRPFGSAGHQLEEQPVHAVDGLGAGAAQFIAAVGHEPDGGGDVIGADWAQAGGPQCGDRHRMRVHGVGLAAVAGGQYPNLG